MRSFHGRTVGALSLTWEPKYRKPFAPLLDVTHVPYNNMERLDAAIDEETAMVIVEPVQGEGGVNIGDAEFLQTAQRLCRERGALLVVDEIQTGFGRTGRWFGIEHFGLQPDIICMAKGIGGGFPMGAIAYTGPYARRSIPARTERRSAAIRWRAQPALRPLTCTSTKISSRRADAMGQRLMQRLNDVLADTSSRARSPRAWPHDRY